MSKIYRYRLLALTILTALLFTLSGVPTALAAHTTAQNDLKGVWVSTVYNLDYPNSGTTSATALRQQADAILDYSVGSGMRLSSAHIKQVLSSSR